MYSLTVLAMLDVIAFAIIPQPSGPPQNTQGHCEGYRVGEQQGVPETFWRRTWCEPGNAFAFVLAGFTAILTSATLGLLITGNRQIQLARDEFEATHRAWLSIHDVEITNLGVQRDTSNGKVSLWVEARFNLRNTGSTPALHTFVWRKMWLDGFEITEDEIAEMRVAAKDGTHQGGGDAVAPDSFSEQRINFAFLDLREAPAAGKHQFHIVKMSVAIAYTDATSEKNIRETVGSFWIISPGPGWTMHGFEYGAIEAAEGQIAREVRRIGFSTMT